MTTAQDAQERSFPLPGFEHRLWEELAALHAEHVEHAEPAGLAGDGAARRRSGGGRRRTAVGLVAAGVAVVAVVAGGRLAGDEGRGDIDGGGIRTEAPAVLAPGDDAIVVMTSGGTTAWQDEATGAWRQVVEETGQETVVAEDSGVTVIDHERLEYWAGPMEGVRSEPEPIAERLRERMATEGMVLEGTEVVDGREVEHWAAPADQTVVECSYSDDADGVTTARCKLPGVEESVLPDVRHEVWIDPASGRPVREVEDFPGDATTEVDTTYEYLPRTPENVALVEVAVPDGFRRVERPGLAAIAVPWWG